MKKLKAYWWQAENFGDTLTPHILEWLTGEVPELDQRQNREPGSYLGIGSIIHLVCNGDIVFSSGSNKPNKPIPYHPDVKFLAVRGPLTRDQLMKSGYSNVPEVYGDGALLLPLIYKPEVKKTHAIGFLPHYVDKGFFNVENMPADRKLIDIQQDWKKVIEEVLSCEKIVSSSLHGIIVAEAYGIPVMWQQYSDKIIGGDYKFQDYFLGTGRTEQEKEMWIPGIPNLLDIQEKLVNAFNAFHRKSTE